MSAILHNYIMEYCKCLRNTLFPASNDIEIRQGITFLFVNESPSNLICDPKYANPTNVVL